MRIEYITVLIIFMLVSSVAGQQINGVVLNKETQQPVKGVALFVSGTQEYAISDSSGTFSFSHNKAFAHAELVITHVAFHSQIVRLDKHTFEILLKPKDIELQEVQVESKKDRAWRRDFKKFEKEFLGQSEFARACEIKNPWVVDFSEKAGVLFATATEPLKIKNKALGYDILFVLGHFSLKDDLASYSGKVLFKPYLDDSEILKLREEAYSGSMRHFFHALKQDALRENNFQVFDTRQDASGNFIHGNQKRAKDLLQFNEAKNKWEFANNGFLKIVYSGEDLPPAYAQLTRNTIAIGSQGTQNAVKFNLDQGDQISYIFSRLSKLAIGDDGFPLKDRYIQAYGFWGWERVGDMMPLDYKVKTTPQDYPVRNGFVLKDLLIPLDQIMQGGPPKDGIPSIDKPKFIDPEAATFLQEADLVMGVELDGQVKAYPIKILNWHEIVNDELSNKNIVVTYCPLCRSGLVFNARYNKKPLSFGVSGLLYNSDVLLYDRQTESLWSQLLSKGVSGQYSGESLEVIPSQLVTWGEWKAQYPNTKVLSTETGFTRDYDQSAYGGYEKSDALMFPVSQESTELPRKELVLGVKVDNEYIAYPFSVLSESGKPIKNRSLTITFNKTGKTATVTKNNETYPSVSMYWFAWYAFHPETKIYGK